LAVYRIDHANPKATGVGAELIIISMDCNYGDDTVRIAPPSRCLKIKQLPSICAVYKSAGSYHEKALVKGIPGFG